MGEPAIELPCAVTLPSGLRVSLGWEPLKRGAEAVTSAPPLARAIELLHIEGALFTVDGNLDVDALCLSDVHLLVALLARASLISEPRVDVVCENCDARSTITPSRDFEPGPFLDGELDDPELDARFDFGSAHPLPALFTGAGIARSVRLAPRTLKQARVLYSGRRVRVSRAVIAALGIEAIGRERRAEVMVRTLSRASDAAWTALGEAWERAHYSPRMFATARCVCGARVEAPAPSARPFDGLATPSGVAQRTSARPAGFPSEETFERLAERARAAIYSKKGVRNIALIIETGVPHCDDGGEPLLGSYIPASGEGDTSQPEIRLYYRTFQSEFRFDESFDVEGEIAETIEHEVEHHLYFLSGHDPMDEEERVAIARERERVVGRNELKRRAKNSLLSDVGAFFRTMAPLLLLLAALAILQILLR